jgi:hypothetical protein
MSRRKPLAALAAVTAALAVAVPAASATAATTAPTVRTALIGFPVFGTNALTCSLLLGLEQRAALRGNIGVATVYFYQIRAFCPQIAIWPPGVA